MVCEMSRSLCAVKKNHHFEAPVVTFGTTVVDNQELQPPVRELTALLLALPTVGATGLARFICQIYFSHFC
jgi:hypothetical protein